MITKLKNKVLRGEAITKEDACTLINSDLAMVCSSANEIRQMFCGNHFDMCTIVNAKSGRCTEDCKYCAQSAHYPVKVQEYPLLSSEEILKDATHYHHQGILRYSVVTSGRTLKEEDVDEVCKSYALVKNHCNLSLCASHGLLSYEQFVKLKAAGVVRYHNNLETSKKNFHNICTTHTYDDKINAIKAAQRAGLSVCSGGIMGMGETMEDRIDMAMELKELSITSVPINILNPIQGTPFAHMQVLTQEEVARIVAIYRFILPKSALRLAGGRGLLADKGRCAFLSGANAAISGDMLTTQGICVADDKKMVECLGYEIAML